MATQATFPLSLICSVSVSEATTAVSSPLFNQALVLGSSAVIPSYGTEARARQYSDTADMLTDGFTITSPEYLWAAIYFSQDPAPTYLWVGRLDLTAVQTIVPNTAELGLNYAVGDTITPTQSGLTNTVITVSSVGTGGTVTGLTVKQGGTGAVIGSALATTTSGSGTGLEVDITAVGETALQAVTACRAASTDWYAFAYPQGVAADHIALATWADQTDEQAYYWYATQDAAALAGTTGNVFQTLYAESVGHNFGVYSTSQSNTYPNNPYASAAYAGLMMGNNTGLANSAFSIFNATLTDIATEPITTNNLTTLTAEGGNAYISVRNAFKVTRPGVDPTGVTPDEQLYIDQLVSNIQYACANVFVAHKTMPQTDAGQKKLLAAAKSECANMVSVGFIASSGTWTGASNNSLSGLTLTTGDTLPLGYQVQSPLFANQSKSDRDAHKMMPIYVSIIEAGSGRSIAVQINVQQ